MADLPTDIVTLLFTDIAGSTQLLQRLGTRKVDEEAIALRVNLAPVVHLEDRAQQHAILGSMSRSRR